MRWTTCPCIWGVSMSQADRERWDYRYANPGADLKKGPHALLMRYASPPQPHSRALELACGLGHDALWLAGQGYTVDAVDISREALRQARTEMQRRGLRGVNWIQADLDNFPLPEFDYDLVYVFRFLDRALFPAISTRVRPGGLVIYETVNVRRQDSMREEHMLQLGELPGYFPGWTVLQADDRRFLSSFVGRKPEA
jgi:tellurite methyltransferase